MREESVGRGEEEERGGDQSRQTKMTSSPHNCHQSTKFQAPTINLYVFSPPVFTYGFIGSAIRLLTRNTAIMTDVEVVLLKC